MQGYPGPSSNVVIDSNRIIRQTDPNLPFPTYLQGIDAFDGDWTNLTVTNNVVVTSSCWGIGFASVHGGKIMVRNNITSGIGLYNVDRKMTIDHDICLATTGRRTARPPACGPSQ
jgi:hypothetical protein